MNVARGAIHNWRSHPDVTSSNELLPLLVSECMWLAAWAGGDLTQIQPKFPVPYFTMVRLDPSNPKLFLSFPPSVRLLLLLVLSVS